MKKLVYAMLDRRKKRDRY